MSRLEEIKEVNGVINHKNPAWQEEIDWLINRVEELEEELALEKSVNLNFDAEIIAENQRYKQALEQIKDDGYDVHGITEILDQTLGSGNE